MRTQAVMFDIDDTLIDVETGKTIPYSLNLLNRCREAGLHIVIITARPGYDSNIQWTEDQLRQHGILYHELWFCPMDHKNSLKHKLGYEFLLSVGDRLEDLGMSKRNLLILKH